MTTIETGQHTNPNTVTGANIDRKADFQQALLTLARTGDGSACLASIEAARQHVQEAIEALKCHNPESGR